jgi:hypothetical protein
VRWRADVTGVAHPVAHIDAFRRFANHIVEASEMDAPFSAAPAQTAGASTRKQFGRYERKVQKLLHPQSRLQSFPTYPEMI